MKTNAVDHPRWMPLAWSAVNRTAGLLIVGLIAWFRLFSAAAPAWRAVSLVAVLALATLGGVAWFLPRARAERKWRATLDRYAEQEQANEKAPLAAGWRASHLKVREPLRRPDEEILR